MITNGMLPILLVVICGFMLGRTHFFNLDSAREMNRVVFFFGMPVLGISILTEVDFTLFNFRILISYLAAQFITGLLGGWLAHSFWHYDLKTSILVGMSTALANHVLYVLPIAENLYEGYIITQITAIIVMDVILVTFVITFLLEYASNSTISIKILFKRLLRIPLVLGVLTGLTIAITGINLPIAILTFLKFSYSCAAPLALFALGIILAKSKLTDNLNFALNISIIKVLIHQVLLAVIGFGVLELSLDDLKPGLMVAAAPCGAMVLVFASAYNVDPKPLAPLVVISFLLSLPGLALVIFL